MDIKVFNFDCAVVHFSDNSLIVFELVYFEIQCINFLCELVNILQEILKAFL